MFCMGFSHFLSTKSAHKVFGQSEVMVENIYPRCHTKEQNLKQCGWKASTFLSHATIPAPVCVNDHAGYIYCGACAAHAYRQIDPQKIKRIFILGPAHHVRLYGCALSSMEKYQTPFYDLTIDSKVYKELMATGHLEQMSRETDEQEHSIEMHLPYIAKVMESKKGQFTIVPILVGSLQGDKEKIYGKLLGEYLSNPENLFVVSSDFCHWGRRFNFIYNDEAAGEIWQSIESLDRMGMSIIERMDAKAFSEYLQQYQNTICGRHPIMVLLHAIESIQEIGHNFNMKFLKYAQSSQVKHIRDSSVSYASAALTIQ
ncbi:protein MEMO1 isoform X1 [Octopus sinensis]|uniref:Protein MEMO1 isoform X1 n=1 Tax=Octopus sinensis TaxID=2607531 RepID=A0A7E6F7S8_9MOLL|nr:protein MEMO1 isoform X1 [Octopus sinensis]